VDARQRRLQFHVLPRDQPHRSHVAGDSTKQFSANGIIAIALMV
jgi:hypothetical protein